MPEAGGSPSQPPSDGLGVAGPEAFARLVDENYQQAYRFALSLVGNNSDACDLTQQAFLIARIKGHQLREAAKAKQWLFTILHREFLGLRRRATAHPEANLEFVEHELPLITVDHAASIDAKDALAVLQTLEVNFKAPLGLFYMEQLSYKEIAVVLEIPIGTVMSRLARGKQMLRTRLEQRRVETERKILPLPKSAASGPGDG